MSYYKNTVYVFSEFTLQLIFFLCYYYREILLTSQSTDWQTQENQKLIVHILNKDVSFVEAEIKFIWHAKIISESISFYLAQGRGSEIC